jgi:hypothetical protein
MPKGTTKAKSGSTSTKTTPKGPKKGSLTNNTVINNLVDKTKKVGNTVKSGVDTVEDKVTDKIDEGVGVVDKYTHSLGKDETIKSKGGTVKGFNEAESMVTVDAEEDANQRFDELADLLFRNAKRGPVLREGTLDLFNKITPRLAGGGVLKDMDHRKVNGIYLTTALRRCFKGLNDNTGDYLVDMLRNDGIPSHALQILDAMGYVSVKQRLDEKNFDEVIKGICKGMTPDEAKKAKDELKAYGVADDHIPKQVESVAKMGKKAEKIKGGDEAELQKWLLSWDKKLADTVTEAHDDNKSSLGSVTGGKKPILEAKKIKNIVAAVRKQLGKIIETEIEFDRDGAVRDQLAEDHGQFEAALTKIKYIDAQLRDRLITSVTTTHRLLTVRTEEPSEYETDEEKQVRQRDERKEDAKNLASLGVARALLGNGGVNPDELKKKGGLTSFIEKMSPEGRQMLVASYLPSQKGKTYLTPSTPRSDQEALFTEAWETGLRPDVESALFNQEKLDKIETGKSKKKSQEEKDDVAHQKRKVVRIQSLLRFAGDAGPNYLALLELAEEEVLTKISTTTYGTRIWEIALRMKGAELFQIRNDLPLLLRLRKLVKKDLTKPSITNWDKFIEMMQLPTKLKLKGNDKDDKATLTTVDIENRDANGNLLDDDMTLGQAYQAVGDNIEFSPVYWRAHVHRLVKMLSPSWSDTYSVISRAQGVAKRWVKHEQLRRDGEHAREVLEANKTGDETPAKPGAPTEAEFMRQIYEMLSEADRKSLKTKIPKAYEALAEGKHLTVDTRLDRAKSWKLGGSQTSLNTNKAAIVSSFEDLNGRELMAEWSNFAELRSMHKQHKTLTGDLSKLDKSKDDYDELQGELQGRLDSVQGQMARYWPSINRAKLKYIEKNLAGGTRTEVLGMLATKLAGAMRGDAEFKEAAAEAGLTADDYDAERLMFGHMMNKRRQLDSGLQFGAKSQIGALKSMRSMLSDPTKLVSFGKDGGNKHINKSTSQVRKAQSNIYLAKVRNTQSQLNEVQKDTSLTDEERTEKAKHVREVSSEDIQQTREELEKRNKAFNKARKQLSAAITRVLQILLMVAVSAATMGQGTVAVIVSAILAGIAREAAKSLAKWAIMGDAYEHKDLAKAILIGAVKGALRAATMELLTVLDAASSVVDFDPTHLAGLAQEQIYGQLAVNASVEAAMRSGMVELPVNTLKYVLNTERPFRDFGRNLDVFIAQNAVSVIGRQANLIVGSLAGQASEDVGKLFQPTPGAAPGNLVDQARFNFEDQAKAQVSGLVGRLAIIGKKAKLALKKAATTLWGKYPETWKKLANESVAAIGARQELEGIDENDLPGEAEIDRLMAIVELLAEGKIQIEDMTAEDKASLGILIAYAQAEGVGLP